MGEGVLSCGAACWGREETEGAAPLSMALAEHLPGPRYAMGPFLHFSVGKPRLRGGKGALPWEPAGQWWGQIGAWPAPHSASFPCSRYTAPR